MNVHPHIIRSTRFIFDHYDPMKQWGWPIALGWVWWHASMGFMATIMSDDGKIIALGIVRPVKKPEDGAIAYEYDESGKHLFIDIFLSKHRMGLVGLSAIFHRRFGPRESVSFFRKSESGMRTYDHNRLRKKVLAKKVK